MITSCNLKETNLKAAATVKVDELSTATTMIGSSDVNEPVSGQNVSQSNIDLSENFDAISGHVQEHIDSLEQQHIAGGSMRSNTDILELYMSRELNFDSSDSDSSSDHDFCELHTSSSSTSQNKSS